VFWSKRWNRGVTYTLEGSLSSGGSLLGRYTQSRESAIALFDENSQNLLLLWVFVVWFFFVVNRESRRVGWEKKENRRRQEMSLDLVFHHHLNLLRPALLLCSHPHSLPSTLPKPSLAPHIPFTSFRYRVSPVARCHAERERKPLLRGGGSGLAKSQGVGPSAREDRSRRL
jgi:hypothetical protein